MTEEKDKRRSFLKHILAGSAVVAATAAALKPAKARTGPGGSERDEVLYSESAEFRKYYKSLRS